MLTLMLLEPFSIGVARQTREGREYEVVYYCSVLQLGETLHCFRADTHAVPTDHTFPGRHLVRHKLPQFSHEKLQMVTSHDHSSELPAQITVTT